MVVWGFEGGGQDVEQVALLLAAGLDDRQQGFHDEATSGALGAEGQFAPDHGVTQHLFGANIGRLHAGMGEEHPELVPEVEQVLTQRGAARVRGLPPVFESLPQVVLNSEPNAVRHRAARDCPGTIIVPVVEHLAQLGQQPLADGGTGSTTITQSLEVACEVRPADLPTFIKSIRDGAQLR